MNWLSSLFSSSSSQSSRKGQAMNSTHEAFSIPTSSPIFSSHPDAFNPDVLNTPDTAHSSSYTYPPSSPVTYGYIPTFSGSNSRHNSLLPTHHDQYHTPIPPPSSYPPLANTWNRLRTWLNREYPELGDTLNYGILPQDLAQIEMQFGFALPNVVRESYLAVDGQEAESAAGCSEGLFFGLNLLPLEDVLEEWRFWREVDDDPSTGGNVQLREAMQSIPPGWIRREYSQRGWIPLVADKAGNYIGVDLNPADSGAVGQVIVFGRDFDTKVVLYNGDGPAGWARWLASFVEELESGEGFEIGRGNEETSDSEDDVGYAGYYNDGSGSGDGGGDSGSGGGLRLIGEYRGWNVLEAWADRSVRRWYETGVISETINEKGKAPEKAKIASLDLSHGSAAEVAIPVLTEIGDGEETAVPIQSSATATPTARRSTMALPTISVTKPPVPLPVELPTPRDIVALPSPPDSTHSSFDDDLEAGRIRKMQEVSRENVPVSQQALPPSDATSSVSSVTSPPSPPPEDPDLLVDSDAVLETTPIISATSLSPPPPEIPVFTTAKSDFIIDAPSDSALVPEEDPSTDSVDPDVTIRLVGGGGSSGIALVDSIIEGDTQVNDTEPDDTASVASLASTTSESSVTKEKKHKKTKSGLAGLKKLGQLGKRKDSVSSVKDTKTDSKS